MDINEAFFESEIKSRVRFGKTIETVFDLSYLLIDFQAIINNLVEMIHDNNDMVYILSDEKQFIEELHDEKLKNEGVNKNHTDWQKEIEHRIESLIYEPQKKVANINLRSTSGYKKTTTRRFNEKYRMNLMLNDFSKGSLVLDLINSLAVSILTEFLKELVFKKTGKEDAININIYNNQYILIDGESFKKLPKDSCVRDSVKIIEGNNENNIDVQKCIYNIVQTSKPDENIEESVKRLFVELEKNGVINKQFTYDERGIKTAVKDIDRFLGYFMDVRI